MRKSWLSIYGNMSCDEDRSCPVQCWGQVSVCGRTVWSPLSPCPQWPSVHLLSHPWSSSTLSALWGGSLPLDKVQWDCRIPKSYYQSWGCHSEKPTVSVVLEKLLQGIVWFLNIPIYHIGIKESYSAIMSWHPISDQQSAKEDYPSSKLRINMTALLPN